MARLAGTERLRCLHDSHWRYHRETSYCFKNLVILKMRHKIPRDLVDDMFRVLGL